MRYYSCDSHVVEAKEVYDGLEARFGDRAPRIERDYRGKRGDWVVLPNASPVPVGRLGIAGNRLDDPKTTERIARGYDGLNPGVRDPHKRLDEQAQDGIVGEVMYPSLNMFAFNLPDRDVVKAVFERHNDWVLEYCSANPDRLVGIGCLGLPDVEVALAEMTRAANRGVRGFAIPAHVPPERPYCHPDFDPFWAAAEEFGVPLTMHIFTNTPIEGGLPKHWGTPGGHLKGYTMAHTTAINTMIDLICGGVVERFPKLKFIISEFETGWVGHFLQRMDHAIYRTPKDAVDYLTMKPSDYFHRNFYVTFEDDIQGIQTRDSIGVNNLVWGNDYPHHDAIWPNSMSILDRIFEGVPDAERERMVFSNAVELYNIDVAKLPAAA
ncbi:MAG: amidohydrolase [Acidimicrobiia bacterium]|nr:amidohydrolase [Acidimicrobiia bacterium]